MTMAEGAALPDEPLHLPTIAQGLPPVPAPALDPYLDAAAACFARHGISRTGVPDIARELDVSRTTVYRQIGTVEQAARLLLARELHRFLAHLPSALEGASGPETVTRLIGAVVRFAREHPVLHKVLADEPELLGPYLTRELPDLVGRVSTMAAPLLAQAMNQQFIRRCDPEVLAEFLVRTTISVILAPPPGDVVAFLDETIMPIVKPS